jgi:hypothetical protein
MKRSVALLLSSAACAVAVAGCGLTSSPADGLTFTAPSGWHASPGIMGFAQVWTSTSNSDEVLMLFRSPKELDREQVFESGKLKDAQIDQQRQITICGNQPATYLKGTAQSSVNNQPNKPHILEMTMSNSGGNTYFAMYVYSPNRHPNAQAESALRELCVKQ